MTLSSFDPSKKVHMHQQKASRKEKRMSEFKYLFSPIKIRNVELKNRISMNCLTPMFVRGSEQDCAFYEARAKGGTALIGLACAITAQFNANVPGFATVGTEEGREAHRRTIDAIHRGGAKAYIQVFVGGGPQAHKDYPIEIMGGQNRTATAGEVEWLINGMAEGAKMAQDSGADGVEFPISSGHSIQCYVSDLYNLRTDDYNGTAEERAELVIRAMRKARELVGPDFLIGIQAQIDEAVVGGDNFEDMLDVYEIICKSGCIDWIRPSGNNVKPLRMEFQYPNSYMPQNINEYICAELRERIGEACIVIGSHGIRTAETGEESIAAGYYDMIGMGRALIADPELANKARAGQSEDIHACIGCSEGCYQNFEDSMAISCTVNPEAGREYLQQITPAEAKKKVLVVGGGACGMEAAIVAAQRGHEVTLVEKEQELGGIVRLHAALPGLGDRGEFIRHMEHTLAKEGVEVRKGVEMTAADITSFGADAVLLATGAPYGRSGRCKHRVAPVAGAEGNERVFTPEDVIFGGANVGEHVVIYDATGYEVGPGLAEMFADQGKTVEFVTPDFCMGRDLLSNGIFATLAARVAPKLSAYYRDTLVTGIEGNQVQLTGYYTFEEMDPIDNVDSLVLVTARPPADELYHELEGKVEGLQVIGDATFAHLGSRCIYNAMLAGREAALAL